MPLLEIEAIHKSFPGVQALRPLDLSLAAGEAVGLVGENGAGKSTLIKILSGVLAPDGGQLRLAGAPFAPASPRAALDLGIATIHQELSYCPRLTVAENLLLGEPWPRRRWGAVNWRSLQVEASVRLQRFGLELEPGALFQSLTAAEKQEVAIARALARQARILILDEPTASLTEPEANLLLERLDRLKREGVGVLYVSHRLDEVLRLCDRIVVLRDGAVAAAYPAAGADAARMARDMAGGQRVNSARRERPPVGDVLLEARGLGRRGAFEGLSFSLRAGEILGLAGLAGSGRLELGRCLYGLLPRDAGEMFLRGERWTPGNAGDARRAGIALVPEERKRQGLVLDHPVGESIGLGFTDRLARWGWIPRDAERRAVDRALARCAIRARGPAQRTGALSGGNQQKALLARWLAREPDVLLLNEPTRGVDVGAKAEIHALIEDLARAGKGIILATTDLPELVALADRALVLARGRLAAELRGSGLTRENLLLAASGLPLDAAPATRPQGGGSTPGGS